MTYNLKFRKKGEKRGYWNCTIVADNDEEAIIKSKEYIKDKGFKKVKLCKTIYKEKIIYDFDKEVE